MDSPASDYAIVLELLQKAELAARNGEWNKCGTSARKAMNLAFTLAVKVHEQSKPRDG